MSESLTATALGPKRCRAMAIDEHDDLDTARGLLAAVVLSLVIWLLFRSL